MRNKSSVVLPSIHEMFPEHLMAASSPPRTQSSPQPPSSSHLHTSVYQLPLPQDRRRSVSEAIYPYSRSIHHSRNHHSLIDASPTQYRPYGSPTTEAVPSGFANESTQRADPPEYSFDVLRSDPSSSSLQHIASSATFPNRGTTSSGYNPHGEVSSGMAPAFRVSVTESPSVHRSAPVPRPPRSSAGSSESSRKSPTGGQFSVPYGPGYPSIISFPVTGSTEGAEPTRAESPDVGNSSDGDLSSSNGKKHICPTCSKRFNRPSSLRIHINTHTGVTPFRCPWPNCGREFNVNSNMRRHYRNHTSPGFSRPHPSDTRRRRKRQQSQELVFVSTSTTTSGTTSKHGQAQSDAISSVARLPPMDDSDDNMSDDDYPEDEVDELDSHTDMDLQRSTRHARSLHSSNSPAYHHHSDSSTHYSQSHLREYRMDPRSSSFGNNSDCAPPSLQSAPNTSDSSRHSTRDHIYSPSAPYVHSLTNTRVSTALRPAFQSQSTSPMES